MTRSADDEGYAELPRIPISTRNHQPRQLKSFSHSGDLGDIVYFLPVMRAMGGKLKITRADPAGPPTRQNLLENRAWKTIQELLEYQEYVETVEPSEKHDADVDGDAFRRPFFAALAERIRSGKNSQSGYVAGVGSRC